MRRRLAERPAGARSRSPTTATTPASSPGEVSTPRSSTLRRGHGVDVREGDGVDELVVAADGVKVHCAGGDDDRSAPPRRGRRPLVDGAPAARIPTRRATSARGTRCASTSTTSTTRASGSCSPKTCSPGTRGCSRCRTAARTSASACCADGRTRTRPEGALARPARAADAARHPRPERDRARTGPRLADPDRVLARRASTDGPVLYAGDAAAVVDPMTGEGIAQAFETGIAAADAIAGGGDTDAVAQRYRAHVDRALGRDLRFAARLQKHPRVTASARAARSRPPTCHDWTRRSFGRWLFEGYPRAVLLTPDRWHRRRFTAPGAFWQTPATRHTARCDSGADRPWRTARAEVKIAKSPGRGLGPRRRLRRPRRVDARHRRVRARRRRPQVLQTMGIEIHEQLKEHDDDRAAHRVLDREVADAARAPPRDDHASPRTATARSSRGRTRSGPTRWPARSARSTKARRRRSRRKLEG